MQRIFAATILALYSLALGASEPRFRVLIGTIAAADENSSTPDASTYLITRLVAAIEARLGAPKTFEIVPFARAIKESRFHSNVIIAPLARTPLREPQYRWLIPLYEDNFVVISLSDSSAEIDPNKVVGAVRDTAMYETAESLGFKAVDPVTDDVQNVYKLLRGRVDLWLTSQNQAVKAIQYAGADPALFHFSAPVRTVTIYVAAPASIDSTEAERWRAAGESLRADGTFDAILKAFPELNVRP